MAANVRIIATGVVLWLLAPGAGYNAAAQQQGTAPKIEQKDFVDKVDDVRRSIERERTQQNAPRDNATQQFIVDVCKRNPNLPQCKI
jgi:hypothetical protein